MAFSDFFQKLKDRLSGAGQMARTPDFAEGDRPEFFSSLGQPNNTPAPTPIPSVTDPQPPVRLPVVQSSRLAYSPDMLPDNNGPAPAPPPAEDNPLAPRNQQWFNRVKPYIDQAAGGDPIAQREAQAVISGTKINPTKMDRFKQIILPALAGMAQGSAAGGGWGGLGGAIVGGLTGAVNPQAGVAYRYKMFQQPQDEQLVIRENMRVKQEREDLLARAKAQQEGAAADLARARAAQARRPALPQMVGANIQGFRDPVTGAVTPNSLYTPPVQRDYVVNGNLVGPDGKVKYSAPKEEKPLSESDVAKAAEAEVAKNLDIQKAKEQFANDMRSSVYGRMGVTPQEAELFAKGYPGKRQIIGADGKPTMVDASEGDIKQYQSIAQRINSAEGVLRKMAEDHGKTLQDRMTAEVTSRYHQGAGKAPAPSTSARPRKPGDLLHLLK